ncbi:MAG: CBS domain-containing protein [Candidatus Aenigmarchaeota archaeon]|nr:CBS domain-containing protein [Candidatus Aenigmarchaeota archaeon]
MMKTGEVFVKDLMKPARTISSDMPISEALPLLKKTELGFLSVIDENGKLIGAVCESSFMRLVKHTPNSPLEEPVWYDSLEPDEGKKPVEAIMTTNITTARPDDDVRTALKVMSSAGYRFIHVVDSDGRLLGVMRLCDVFEKLLGD